jgi:uncharacterized membrane protein YgcG
VIQDTGFGHARKRPYPAHSLQAVLLSLLQYTQPAAAAAAGAGPPPSGAAGREAGAGAGGAAAAAPTASAAAASRGQGSPSPAARGFVNRLLSTLNWTLTEFTVSVGELHSLRGRRSILEVQNQYRRTGLMFELSVNFLRLLEFVVVSWLQGGVCPWRARARGAWVPATTQAVAPTSAHTRLPPPPTPCAPPRLSVCVCVCARAHLPPPAQPTPAFLGQGVNRTRLRELLQFVLSHFTNGPDARRLNELLQTNSSGGGGGTSGSSQAGGQNAFSSGGGGSGGSAAGAAGAGAGTAAAAAAAGGAAGMPPGPLQAAMVAPLSAGGGAIVPSYALSAVRYESSSLSERIRKTSLLAPLVGIFLELWDCHLAAAAGAAGAAGAGAGAHAQAAAPAPQDATEAGGAGSSSSSSAVAVSRACDQLLQELAEVADERFMSSLRFLQVQAWLRRWRCLG